MDGQNHPKVAVLGMSEAGRGWATLVASAGWQVTIYDPDAEQLQSGGEEIATRKRHSMSPGMRSIGDNHKTPPGEPRLGRSLLDAVTTADWIIDATTSDLLHRQRLLEQVEGGARATATVTCGAAGVSPTELCARLRRPGRLWWPGHSDPMSTSPRSEVVPGPLTDPTSLEPSAGGSGG